MLFAVVLIGALRFKANYIQVLKQSFFQFILEVYFFYKTDNILEKNHIPFHASWWLCQSYHVYKKNIISKTADGKIRWL